MSTQYQQASASEQRLPMGERQQLQDLQAWLETQIIGQPGLVNRLLVAILADGHLLVEGAPGRATPNAMERRSLNWKEAGFSR